MALGHSDSRITSTRQPSLAVHKKRGPPPPSTFQLARRSAPVDACKAKNTVPTKNRAGKEPSRGPLQVHERVHEGGSSDILGQRTNSNIALGSRPAFLQVLTRWAGNKGSLKRRSPSCSIPAGCKHSTTVPRSGRLSGSCLQQHQ